MKKDRLFIPLLIFILFGLVFSCTNNKKSKVENKSEKNIKNECIDFPQEEVTRVLSLGNEKKIYLRAKIWGISSNHEEIVFSESPIDIADKVKDYIFYTDEVFYKINGNNLTIYAPKSGKSLPEKSFKEVDIIVKDLKNYDEIKDYSENYKKYDLAKLSIYD